MISKNKHKHCSSCAQSKKISANAHARTFSGPIRQSTKRMGITRPRRGATPEWILQSNFDQNSDVPCRQSATPVAYPCSFAHKGYALARMRTDGIRHCARTCCTVSKNKERKQLTRRRFGPNLGLARSEEEMEAFSRPKGQ